jgi:hypothetical protein
LLGWEPEIGIEEGLMRLLAVQEARPAVPTASISPPPVP